MQCLSLNYWFRAIGQTAGAILCLMFSISMAVAETPFISSNDAEVTDSGINGVCLLCSISDVDNLVDDNLSTQTTMSLPVGVAGSTYACVGANRIIPAGRRAGYVASLNDGVAALVEGTTLISRLDGQVQESLSGASFLTTLIGIGGNQNVVGEFTQPFDEICYQAASVLSVFSIYRVNYAFVLEARAENSLITALPTAITANGEATASITVEARDGLDEPIPGGEDTVELSTTAGTLSPVTDNGDGTYTATLTASTTPEAAEITGTINGEPITDMAVVDFVVDEGSEPDASLSLLWADPNLVPADGSSTAVVTIQARDAFGNNLGVGGSDVEILSTHGSVGPVNDNDNGTYTATVSATTPGEAEITGTIEGDLVGQSDTVIFFDPDAADPDTSDLDAYPTAITANGTSQTIITITARNTAGDPIGSGGAEIELDTTAGELSSTIIDHGDGTYTTLLTSSTTEETATITAMLDGQMMSDTAVVDFVADTGGDADARASLLWATPTVVDPDGLSTALITVEARDAWGNPIGSGGDTVELTTTLGMLGMVTDHGDGTYTATLFSPTSPGLGLVTGTLNGEPIGQPVVVEFASDIEADAGQSTISADPDMVPADGTSTALITVEAFDANGEPLTSGGDNIAIETTLGTLGTTVTDNGDGTYTAVLTAPTTPGTATVTGTLNGEPIGMETEITFFDPSAADPDTSLIDAVPAQITANGSAQALITITARNAAGDPTGSGGDEISVATTAGTLSSSVTDHGDGTYTTMLTSSTVEETATITAMINGQPMSMSVEVEFVSDSGGDADAEASLLWAQPSLVLADGDDIATIHVETRDAWGNPIGSGGDTVELASTLGDLGPVTDHGDGTYSAELTGSVAGLAEVTGTLNGQSMSQSAIVEFTSTVIGDPGQSTISADPDQLPADGSATSLITVEVNDTDGNPVGTGGDIVEIHTTLGTLGATVTDNGDGTYSAVLTAPATPGTATVTGTLNGEPIAGSATILFGDDGIFHDRFEQQP